jgi:hypothetical protein
MKKIFIMFLCLFSTGIKGQVEPSVTYDPTTGNYIIEYEGYEGENQEPTLVNLIYEPTNKITPLVYFRAVFNSESNYFSYQYTIENTSSSLQRLQDFDIEIFASIFEITRPDEFWKTGYYSFAPVFGWFNSKGAGGLSDPLNGIAPDSSETGFSFNSTGYPTISNAYLRGKPEIYLSFPDEPPGEIEALLKPLEKFPNDRVIIKTISPKDPPFPLIISSFLDTLLNYVSQSYMLEWITEETIKNKYTHFFTTAKDQITQGDSSAARSTLENVLQQVDIDSTNNLTSEAYALLRYNTEHLINQIPEGSTGLPVKQ